MQRRLASSPEAIYQSLRRRRERLGKRCRELELLQRGTVVRVMATAVPTLDDEDVENLEGAGTIPPPTPSLRQKFIIFTEHRDTLDYLQRPDRGRCSAGPTR